MMNARFNPWGISCRNDAGLPAEPHTMTQLSPAFVLHSRPWRESSLMVDWFTADWGRMTTCQRGMRRGTKGSAGRPTPFTPMQIGLTGRVGLPVARPIEPLNLTGLTGCWLQGRALAVGFYLNELLLRALHPQEPLPALFAAYGMALSELCAGAEPFDVLLRRFERRLLDALGLGFDWHHTADSGEPLSADRVYRVHPERGIVAEASSGMRLPGRVLCALAADHPQQTVADRQAAHALLTMLLAPVVGAAPFHSRSLWRPPAAPPDQ